MYYLVNTFYSSLEARDFSCASSFYFRSVSQIDQNFQSVKTYSFILCKQMFNSVSLSPLLFLRPCVFVYNSKHRLCHVVSLDFHSVIGFYDSKFLRCVVPSRLHDYNNFLNFVKNSNNEN